MRIVTFRYSCSIFFLFALFPWRSVAASVTLGWYPSSSSDVAGYYVCYGMARGQHTIKVPVGTNTAAAITGLTEGVTYYFVVTVCNGSGIESEPSNEVEYTVPGLAPPGRPWFAIGVAGSNPVLEWTASPSPHATGYNVYFGTPGSSQPQLVYSGADTHFTLTNSEPLTNGYFVVTARGATGQESLATPEVTASTSLTAAADTSAPVLNWQRTSVGTLTNVYSITASGVIPEYWALEASADAQTWGTLTEGSNSPVDVTVAISAHPRLFFRLESPVPGIQLNIHQPSGALPHSFCLGCSGATIPNWTLQCSQDMQTWSDLAAGTSSVPNVAVVQASAPSLLFRLTSL